MLNRLRQGLPLLRFALLLCCSKSFRKVAGVRARNAARVIARCGGLSVEELSIAAARLAGGSNATRLWGGPLT